MPRGTRQTSGEGWCPGVRTESPVLEDFLPSLDTAPSWCTGKQCLMLLANPEKRGWASWQRGQLNVDYRIECELRLKSPRQDEGRGGNAWRG